MLTLFGWPNAGVTAKYWAGSVAQILVAKYLVVHYWCGGIALALLGLEWLATGRPLLRRRLACLALLLGLGLLQGLWLQPELRKDFRLRYGLEGRVTVEQAQRAAQSFDRLHGVSQAINLVVLLGLAGHLWWAVQLPPGPRSVGQTRFNWE